MEKDLVEYAKALGKKSTAELTFGDMFFYHEWRLTGKLPDKKKRKK